MPPDPENPETGSNRPALSVTEVSAALKRTVEDAFFYVRVRGEISQPKVAASGHCYLRLKDENAVLDAIIWRGAMARLGLKPEEGMEVIASGKITTYPGRSSYQIIIESLELAGAGALLKLLEERRKKLAAEGLFDADRKKPLPDLPTVIGVVTSPTGAVIRDILHRIADRFPRHVLIWPVRVQGEGAAAEIAAAIAGFNALSPDGPVPRPDVLIVARGGGSLEDLWAFNEEAVVRAAAASQIPLISAVGHETDWTLIDHAADRRAPTPTAAAEMAVPVRLDLLANVGQRAVRLTQVIARLLDEHRIHLQGLVRGIPRLDVIVADKEQSLDAVTERLALAPRQFIATKTQDLQLLVARLNLDRFRQDLRRQGDELGKIARRMAEAAIRAVRDVATRVDAVVARLESVSPQRVLERGYAMVMKDRQVIAGAAAAEPGAVLQVRFADGDVDVRVEGAPGSKSAPKKRAGDPDSQGRLF